MAIFIVGQFFSEADKNFVFLSLTKQSFYRACDFQPQKPLAEKFHSFNGSRTKYYKFICKSF